MSSSQPCEGCGKPAKEGHRYCFACICVILAAQPTAQPQPIREQPSTYPTRPGKKRGS